MDRLKQNGNGVALADIEAKNPDEWPQLLKQFIQEYAYKPAYGDVDVHTIFDDEHGHYLLFYTGWDGAERVHAPIFHAEIHDGKIHIHWDGAGEGITGELVEAGVPRESIVLDWQPPGIRKLTPFAVA